MKKNETYEIGQLKRRIKEQEEYIIWRTQKIKTALREMKRTLEDTNIVKGLQYNYNKKIWREETTKLVEKPSIYIDIEEQIRRWKEQEDFRGVN